MFACSSRPKASSNKGCRPTAAIGLAVGAGLGLLLLARPAQAAPDTYRLDPTHSFVHFELLHFNASTIRGRFGPLSGEVTLDREARRGRAQAVIEIRQLSTGLGIFDARLKEADLLAAEAHPQAFFVAEQFVFDARGQVSSVRGEFTLRGQGRPLSFTAQRFHCYTSPLFKREVCGGDFEAEFLRSEYGLSFGLPLIADRVRLKLQVEAIRTDP
jgi:polyisoprenoid-binding protein YceI